MRMEASILLHLIAIICSCITLASGSYDTILSIAMMLSGTAVCLLFSPFRHGGPCRRAICVVIALPSLFVVSEFVRRASFLRD